MMNNQTLLSAYRLCSICGMRKQSNHMSRHFQSAQRSVPCPICPQTWFYDTKGLKVHMYQHTEQQADTAKEQEYKSKCTICGYSYSNHEAHMQRHTKTLDRSLSCPICPQTWFANCRFLNNHIAAFHGNAQPQVGFSGAAVLEGSTSRDVKVEPTPIDAEVGFDVSQAITNTESQDSFQHTIDEVVATVSRRDHQETEATRPINQVSEENTVDPLHSCLGAPSTNLSSLTVTDHANLLRPKRSKLTCVVCGMVSFRGLKWHMIRHTQTASNSVPCGICPQTWFPNHEFRKNHLAQFHKEKQSIGGKCTICGMYITRQASHMARHTRTEERSVPCPICPQTWFSSRCLMKHMKRIHGTLSQDSEKSGKVALMDCSAEEDLLRSDGQAQHRIERESVINRPQGLVPKCLVCGMRPRRLNEHMERHTKSAHRAVPCPICPQTWFSSTIVLKNHVTRLHARHNTDNDTNGPDGGQSIEMDSNDEPLANQSLQQTTKTSELADDVSLEGVPDQIVVKLERTDFDLEMSPKYDVPDFSIKIEKFEEPDPEEFAMNTFTSSFDIAKDVPFKCETGNDHFEPISSQNTNADRLSSSWNEPIWTHAPDNIAPTEPANQSINTQSINNQPIGSVQTISSGAGSNAVDSVPNQDEMVLPKMLFCSLCPQTWFSEAKNLNAHMKEKHRNEFEVKHRNGTTFETCQICGIKTSAMASHSLRHTPTEQRCVPCDICPQSWFSEPDIGKHMKNYHQVDHVNGQTHQKLFVQGNVMEEHQDVTMDDDAQSSMRTRRSVPKTFEEQPKPANSTTTASEFTVQPTAQPSDGHPCPVCSICTTNLHEHLLSHAETNANFVACPLCSVPKTWFSNVEDLRTHLTLIHATQLKSNEQQTEANYSQER